MIRRLVTLVLALGLGLSPSFAQRQNSDVIAPEGATGNAAPSSAVSVRRHMVVSAHPLASEAGLDILRQGGSAADAIIAIQAMLGLVEPQSSGLGGGAFLLYYDAASGSLTSYDARETAPSDVPATLFLKADGQPMNFFDAVVGGRSVGVPGIPALFGKLQERHGLLPIAQLLEPAIAKAEQGFVVTPRLSALIAGDVLRLGTQEATRGYFFHSDGRPLQPGDLLRNLPYASTLRTLARDGMDAFYRGEIAGSIVEAVKGHPENPGTLSAQDLAAYRVVERAAVCVPYRGHDVCGMGPPSSGGIAVGQILALLEPYDLAGFGPDDVHAWRLIGDATRLAFADRERFVGDPDFVNVPRGLLDEGYLTLRSGLLAGENPLEEATAGDPPRDRGDLFIDGMSPELPATTHAVVVDASGNVASLTSSIENGFGARLMASGFLLNNQLTDFSFTPERDGSLVANRVEPGKRPRSSMAPTIILKDGKPVYALGSPGGSNIIPYVARTIVALIDWEMDIQQAIALPHLVNRFGPYEIEEGPGAASWARELSALGYEVVTRDLNSGLHGVAIAPGRLIGGADPRREGVALGD